MRTTLRGESGDARARLCGLYDGHLVPMWDAGNIERIEKGGPAIREKPFWCSEHQTDVIELPQADQDRTYEVWDSFVLDQARNLWLYEEVGLWHAMVGDDVSRVVADSYRADITVARGSLASNVSAAAAAEAAAQTLTHAQLVVRLPSVQAILDLDWVPQWGVPTEGDNAYLLRAWPRWNGLRRPCCQIGDPNKIRDDVLEVVRITEERRET